MTEISNREQPPIPTVETIINESAYEASMHFLYADQRAAYGRHSVRPVLVDTVPLSEPSHDCDAGVTEINTAEFDGFAMWAEFYEYDVLDTFDTDRGKRYSVLRRQLGDIALATSPDTLRPLSELLEAEEAPLFTLLWVSHYSSDTSRDSFRDLNHPGPRSPRFTELIRANADSYHQHDELPVERTVRLARAVLEQRPELLEWMDETGIPYMLPQPASRYPAELPQQFRQPTPRLASTIQD